MPVRKLPQLMLMDTSAHRRPNRHAQLPPHTTAPIASRPCAHTGTHARTHLGHVLVHAPVLPLGLRGVDVEPRAHAKVPRLRLTLHACV